MAQWNPYYGVPNQEEQNLPSQNYYGIQGVPYGSMPIQPVNYNGYFVPNNIYSNFGTNLTGTVYNVQELEAQQFANYNQNVASSSEDGRKEAKQKVKEESVPNVDDATSNSTLHATAAEFKPSTSVNSQISSQTYYRNPKNEDNRFNKGAVRKNNDFKTNKNDSENPINDVSAGRTGNKFNDPRLENRKSYSRNNSGQNYNNKSYNRDRNSYNNRGYNKRDEIPNDVENAQSNFRQESRNNRYENRESEGRNRHDNRETERNKYDNRETERNKFDNRETERHKHDNRESERYKHDNRETEAKRHDNRETEVKRNDNRETENKSNKFERETESRNRFENRDTENKNRFDNRENREHNYGRNYRRQDFNRDEPQIESSRPNFRRDNRESNFNRNSRDFSERNTNERGTYSRDNYGKNPKNSFRNNRYDNKYENWRSGPSESEKRNETINTNRGRTENETGKTKSFDRDKKSYRNDKKAEKFPDDDISQRDRLTDQVNKGNLECLVCCDRVRQADKIWHCQKCYHIFHFKCIMKWSSTSKDDNGWRCPACQHVCTEIPSACFCYCGKVNDPPYNPGDTAHSCGDICGRLGIKPGCNHRCNLFCHPGPCPKCEALTAKFCNCGATTQTVKCSAETVLVCTAICSKELNCGVHTCERICHGGDCDKCLLTIEQECFCGKAKQNIDCSKEQNGIKFYSCEQTCDKLLSCKNHTCKELCHPGDCPPCARAPEEVKTCPCGKSKLEVVRTSCLDTIPCCGKICGKRYPLCGTPTNPHVCKSECHEGDCPTCPLTSFVRCRCGHMNCELTCKELVSRTDDARCEKKCTKKRSCGRHKCNQLCCIDIDHVCPLPCNHMLTCGLHRCEQTCHKGRCQPCWRISFDELYCECGAAVFYPPIPCGTKKPHCTKVCTRQHSCEHMPLHTCHSQPECPPCSVLTTKVCHGKHEKRATIPCHQPEFSCGLPCGKELSCGRHKCQLACHKGPCLKENQNCTQSCTTIRESCGHPCGLPCHEPPCAESPCKENVKVTCQCGLRSSTRACVDMAGEYQRIATSMLASKMADMQLGYAIDIADIVGTTTRKQTLKTLECNDECRLVERNRRLAIGLQIRNPDLSAKLTPRYSDFMRQWTKKDSSFCQMVHDKLTELVQLAKQSKQKSRSFSFPSMNREKRQFIHEYCEHFGCESAAYDQEPNRNVVATAARDKAWLPSSSLLELIQRESGLRKVPGPILNRPLGVSKNLESVSLKIPSKSISTNILSTSTSFSNALQQQNKTPEDIDYFNFPSGSK